MMNNCQCAECRWGLIQDREEARTSMTYDEWCTENPTYESDYEEMPRD
jgi:hypothetical protein